MAEEIERLHRRGIPTFNRLSDLSASLRAGYVEEGREGHVVLVCNELTPSIRSALIDRLVNLVTATPTLALAEGTVRAMVHAPVRPASAPAAPSCCRSSSTARRTSDDPRVLDRTSPVPT